MSMNRVAWVLVGAAGLALSLAQVARADDQDTLSGPKVKDKSVPGERRTLTGKGDPKNERAGRLPPRVFERAMGVLHGDDVAGDLKLSADQEEKIRAIHDEFRGQMDDYREAHHDEVMQLREKLPPQERRRVDQFMNPERGPGGPDGEGQKGPGAKGPDGKGPRGKGPEGKRPNGPPPGEKHGPDGGAPDDGMQPMVDEQEAQAARDRLKELLDGAPKPADAHARVMAVLNDAQRGAVTKELERIQKESAERGRDAKGPDGAGPDGKGREDALKLLTPEEREKVKGMTPEERREFIRAKVKDRGGKPKPKDGK